jgi:chromate transporter
MNKADRSAPLMNQTNRPDSLADLFWTFTGLALRGFGGVLPVAQAALVEEKRWLSVAQFRELLAFGQVLPGPNVCNLSLMIGHQFFGLRGALVALAGMMTLPAVIVLVLATVYAQAHELIWVRAAMDGMAAVAAGLMVGTAIKLGKGLTWGWWAASVLAFVPVALLRWPVVAVLLCLLPIFLGAAWRVVKTGQGSTP